MKRGSVATNHKYAYVTPVGSTTLYQYEYSTEKWTDYPPCPYPDSGLAMIKGHLISVGGRAIELKKNTSKLCKLRQRRRSIEQYSQMNTTCSHPAVVSTSDGDYLIVIGGWGDGGRWTATVELFQVKNRRWHKLTDLPNPLPNPSATICGDQLNVIGDHGNGYLCSLQALLSNEVSWIPLPRLPVTESTAATLCGQLVIIGGLKSNSPVSTIHQLLDGKWVKIGSMATERVKCLVLSRSEDKLLIVSGKRQKQTSEEDFTEECSVVAVEQVHH